MKKRILSLLLAFLMLFSMFPAYSTYAVETEKEVSVWYFNSVSEAMEEADAVELYRGGELYLSAILRDDISGEIQWQIEANQDFWVDIQGGTAEDLRISYGMVQSLLGNDSVRMRCIVSDNEEYCSDPFTVMVTDVDNRLAASSYVLDRTPIAPDPLPAPVGVPNETEPIADDEAEPEVTEETEPVVTEETEPAATEETEPAATEETEPAATEETEPAATEETEPAATEETETAATEETEPAATEETEPAATEETEPAATEETEPASTEETEPAATEETEPVVTEKTEPVTAEKTEPVVTEEMVSIVDNAVPLASASTPRIMLLSAVNTTSTGTQNEDVTYYTVTIEYVYGDSSKFAGQRVALPYIAEVASGETLNETVASPSCVGYLPNISSINLADLKEITANVNLPVVYSPAEVSYTVRHYLQNVDNDEYTWVDTTMTTGYTEALTSDNAAKTYTGFTALSHYHEEIAADSSTMIDIYYDRNYYLMSFDLDGGYGVEPIYARYGASVSVGTPYKAGWTFNGWDGQIPSTMPNENRTYKASWIAQTDISFTVAYWLEDANVDGEYNFWGSTTQTKNAGATVQGEDYKDYSVIADSLDTYEKLYSYYDHADTDVVIKGDGSTVVNVYYDRNEYTLKFYYAARTRSEGAYTYKIYGGSTYFFGASNGNSYNNNELDLLNAIYTNDSYDHQWGEITEAPKLNVLGATRNYTTGADTKNGVDYLYLSFTAKYGADISALWPCNVFESATRSSTSNDSGWQGTEAFVSAWNGEHHVYYSQRNSNQTIKGNYNELDYQLLWDYAKYGDAADKTVAYLCFWENGSGDVNWNVPELYRYNIYVPVLTGQEDNQTDYGKYYLWATYDTCDNSTVGEQTAPAINGYTYTGNYTSQNLASSDTSILYDEDGNQIYKEAYAVNFFYTRDQYKLTFVNGDTTAQENLVYFDAAISAMAPTVTYFDSNLADMYVFGGWYTSPDALDGSEFDLTNATMPSSALTLYAKWNLITHNVNIYLTADGAENSTNQIGSTIAVTHDEPVPADSRPDTSKLKHPADESATFIGWFYKDEKGVEQAFDFATMTITADMNIYAKWRSNVMKQVEISYVVKNENGTETQVADTETLMLRLGQTRTFEAKTGSSLYAEYRTGCFPTTASHSITIDDSHIESTEPVTYTFVYKEYGAVPYKVEFYVQLETDADGDGKLDLRPAFKKDENGKAVFVSVADYQKNPNYEEYVEEHPQNDKAVVTELYVPDALADTTWSLPNEYVPNAVKIQRIIVPGENNTYNDANTIQFIYTYEEPDKDNPVYRARYLVQHYIQNVNYDANTADSEEYLLYSYSDEEGLSGDTATASPISIPGYTFSPNVTDDKKQTGTTLGADNSMSGTITADDKLELNFYYTVNSYPYQVMYLEEGTNRVLADAKTEVDGNQLSGLYGSKVTEEAISIDGYDVVGSSTKSIYIQMEAGDTASVNTIVFYYVKKNADLIITKTVEIDAAQAELEQITDENKNAVANQSFVFTVTAKDGFLSSVYNYTIYAADGTVLKTDKITTKDTYTLNPISIIGGQQIQIHDLPMGEYTVTEAHVVGFRTTVDGTITPSAVVKLETAEQDVTVNFVNTFPFYTGDLVIVKVVHDGSNVVTPANTNYKVKITLNPAAETRELERVITWTNGDGKACTFTVPTLTDNAATSFEIIVDVPAGGEVKMEGVPAGSFTVDEVTNGSTGTITDYYSVSRKVAVHQSDETRYEDGASITSKIHGGHPTAVTFRNTYKNGSLIINKTVTQKYENDNWQSDTFTFTITGTTELPDGDYIIEANGKTATVTVTNGELTFTGTISISKTDDTTSWSGSLTYEDLPAGYYTVTESSSTGGLEQYTVTSPAENLLVNNTANATEFAFTNTYKRTTGSLQVGKEIRLVTDGAVIDEAQEFTFVVEPKDSTLTGTYSYTVKTTNGTSDTNDDTVVKADNLPVEDGKLTFNMKHNQYILIEGLPVGEYLVKEEAVEGYDSSFGDEITNAGNYSVDPATITTNNTTVLNCQNAYPVYYSNLIVKKTVVTPADHSAVDQAPADDVFTFTVKISNYSSKISLDGGISAKFYDSADDTTPEEKTLTVTSDTLSFQLKHGQWVDLNLPACTYTITETGLDSTVNSDVLGDHYDTTYSVGDTVGSAGASYTLISGETETVAFTNTYKRHYVDLTITTTCADSTQSFLFDVSATNTALGNVSLTVVLVGNDSQTIKDLPVGDYTVTEQTEWSWREADVTSQTVELRTKSVTVLFDFGVIDRIYWLSGYSYNYRKKGGG